VGEDQVDEAVNRIAAGQKKFTDAPKNAKAKEGDQLIIDFLGKVDGVAFEAAPPRTRRWKSVRAASSPASRNSSRA
jgi:hypothetical protein